MGLQTATNPETGARVALIGGEWKPIEQSATNPQGLKAYKIGGAWMTDEPAASAPESEIPAPREQSFGRQIAGVVVPTVTSLGGGAVGMLGGPVGGALGAGGGYAAGEAALRNWDISQGNAPAQTPIEGVSQGLSDIALGTSLEAGGAAAAPYLVKGAGWLYDKLAGQIGVQKAAKIVKEAFGTGLPAAKQLTKNAPEGLTAAQSIAPVNAPTVQALLENVSGRTPFAAANKLSTQEAQEAVRLNKLADLAGGASQTAAKTSQIEAKKSLNKLLTPVRETELEAANIAGKTKPILEAEAQRLRDAAANKVEDVRRFTAAGERNLPQEPVVGLIPPPARATPAGTRLLEKGQLKSIELGRPVSTGRYTYEGELAKKAEQVADQAANASLNFGQAAQFKQAAADSLAAHGLKPLESKSISNQIENVLSRPEFAGSRDTRLALNRVNKDIQEWTNSGGVIDAFALDSIRKNSINSVVQALLPNAEAKAQKALAAKLTGEVRPLIVDAIEKAGGTGYGQYLKDYTKGMQVIGQQKLGGKALDLYKANPEAFVKLVEGNSPKEVEKIFGPGSYDLAQEMSAEAMKKLRGVAGEVTRDINVATQAKAGTQAYKELLDANTGKFKFPAFFSAKTTAANAVISQLEDKLGKKVMGILTDASKSGKSLDALLNTMPATERVKILRALSTTQAAPGTAAATINALSPNTNQNNLSQ